MPRCPGKCVLGIVWIHVLLALVMSTGGRAATHPDAGEERSAIGTRLFLEVYLNGVSTGLIGEFEFSPNSGFSAKRAELIELGLKIPAEGDADDRIELNTIPGLETRYDEAAQQLYITLGDELRVVKMHDAIANMHREVEVPHSDYGGVLNYWIYAATRSDLERDKTRTGFLEFEGANATLDARLFGPFGTLSSTGIVGMTAVSDTQAIRHETTWSYSDPSNLLTYRAGDLISSGLAWTRPIRLGGLQLERNFDLRPDLVTMPLPTINGSAAVPSVVEVYVNGLKTYSQAVQSGPYQIDNVPVISGSGEARVVVQDSSGRQVETTQSFYASPRLLREGLADYSIEAGFPRLQFGIESNEYVSTPAGSGSLRYGLADNLALEAHAEAGGGLYNGGFGFVSSAGAKALISIAGSVSHFDDEFGALGYAAFETEVFGIRMHASTRRTFGDYNDLASITARSNLEHVLSAPVSAVSRASRQFSGKPPKALDTVSLGMPIEFDKSSVALSFVHLETHDDHVSDLINLSYSRPFFFGGSAYVTAFTDLRDTNNSGIFAGVSIPLGGNASVTTSASHTPGSTTLAVDATKPLDLEPGSYGWRVRDQEGDATYRSASIAYRSKFAKVEGEISQDEHSARGTASIEGALVTMGGKFFATNRIDDSFAVVSTGVPDVGVRFDNRYAGTTDSEGDLLVTGLRSYEENLITLDATTLPVEADAPETKKVVVPAHRSGALADMSVTTGMQSAVVIVKTADGNFPPAGTVARIAETGEESVVGYDGRTFFKKLLAQNELIIAGDNGTCRAGVAYEPSPAAQVEIGPVVCQ